MRTGIVFLIAIPLWAQDSLSLREAVQLSLRENAGVAGIAAGVRASDARIAQARAGMLPKVNYSESFARSDNPTFVFSSLLTQHQFGAGNFAIGPLNRPDFLNNFQSQLTLDQTLYDAGQTRNAVKSAELARKMTAEVLAPPGSRRAESSGRRRHHFFPSVSAPSVSRRSTKR